MRKINLSGIIIASERPEIHSELVRRIINGDDIPTYNIGTYFELNEFLIKHTGDAIEEREGQLLLYDVSVLSDKEKEIDNLMTNAGFVHHKLEISYNNAVEYITADVVTMLSNRYRNVLFEKESPRAAPE